MQLQISEMAKLSGVSVRTLHYYDEIGLLTPSTVSDTGYRYYDEEAVEKLQQILFYRELEFTLKQIMSIMNAPNYQKGEALSKQKELLMMKRERLNRLISLIEENLEGERTMSFEEFDMKDIEQAKDKYAKEVKEIWGNTDAYQQNQEKIAKFTKEDWANATQQMNALIQRFAELVGTDAKSVSVQKLVAEWQEFIDHNYYHCTKEILAGIGQMYIADERFMKNIDQFKVGTAQLMSEAIAYYCR